MIAARLLIALALLPSPCWADEPQKFFEHNFAQGPELTREEAPQRGVAVEESNITKTLSPIAAPSEITEVTADNSEFKSAELKATEYPIDGISLIANAQDQQHFSRAVAELSAVVLKYGIVPLRVYSVGAFLPVRIGNTAFLELTTRGTDFQTTLLPPEKYDIKLSPTWVIATPKGEIVLEAVGALEKFINTKGNLVVPSEFSAR